MQKNGNQTSAQWDVSDCCHQAEGTNFVFFCHSDSGYSQNRDLQVALPSRTQAAVLSSLSFPSLLTLPRPPHQTEIMEENQHAASESHASTSPLELNITFLPSGLDSAEATGGVSHIPLPLKEHR